jgi:AAA+ ATPase superfamily predicted ATPase
VPKPQDLFDRDREWGDLEAFVTTDRPGAMLGLVYGRRRQGKTFLLELLTEQHEGFYFSALSHSPGHSRPATRHHRGR